MAEVGATGADTSGLDVARRRAAMQALSEDDREGTHPPRDPVDSAPKKLTVVQTVRFTARRWRGDSGETLDARVAARALTVTLEFRVTASDAPSVPLMTFLPDPPTTPNP
jgi:hypothetical protein